MTSSQKGRIFLSYRRADSRYPTLIIYDRLVAHFGEDAVFMDVETIDAGVNFVKVLQDAVQSCDVFVAVIGQGWLDIQDEKGKRRIDNDKDFVRIEVSTALARDIRVIPVLLDGIFMPKSSELPDDLKPLAKRNAFFINHNAFHADVSRLIPHLERALQEAEASKVFKAKQLLEEQELKRHQVEIEKLLHRVNIAINLNDWALAGGKLKEILAIDTGHIEAQAKLELVEERLAALEEKKKVEAREQEEEKQRKQRQELETAAKAHAERLAREKAKAEEKVRQDSLRKERQQERVENIKKFFSGMGMLPIYISGGIVILFLLGYIFSRIDFTAISEPTQPIATATSTIIPTSTPPDNPTVGSTWTQTKDGMVMVYVPAGEFQMGSENFDSDEKPINTIYLDAFWIDQTEVTNAMYAKCVAVGECDKPDSSNSYTRESYYGNPGFDNYPVIWVSWDDANNYCAWAGRHLPSEAEWEKAAGWDADVGVQRIYPWGNFIDDSYANFDGNVGDTTAVGSYEKGASFYGTFDVAGNVWEWVGDWYAGNYYVGSPSSNPLRPDSGSSRVLRGGMFSSSTFYIRPTDRSWNEPAKSGLNIGFRCARSAVASNQTLLPTGTEEIPLPASEEIAFCRYEFVREEHQGDQSTWLIYTRTFGLSEYTYDTFLGEYAARIKCADDQTVENNTYHCLYLSGDDFIPSDSILDFPDVPIDACNFAGGVVISPQ